ncbi:MAG: hypothetical protein INR65_02555 [Gluconacetobacter diazotrophicus]|nr:hypothetical protein [Gluconacetobacter diazotrophicus]
MMPFPDPDKTDEFAAHLRAQPPAGLPAHWRAEILAAAGLARSAGRPPRWRRIADALAAWLWPHPLAYAALTAAWALILTLRLLTAPPQPISSRLDPALAAVSANAGPQAGAPLFASVRLAGQESAAFP